MNPTALADHAIFTPLRDLLDRIRGEREQTGHPYDLEEGDVAALDRLRGTDAHEALVKVAEFAVQTHAEKLLRTDDPAEIHRLRGTIDGIRELPFAIEHVILHEEHKNDRRERERAERQLQSEFGGRISRYGTPAWRRRNGND